MCADGWSECVRMVGASVQMVGVSVCGWLERVRRWLERVRRGGLDVICLSCSVSKHLLIPGGSELIGEGAVCYEWSRHPRGTCPGPGTALALISAHSTSVLGFPADTSE